MTRDCCMKAYLKAEFSPGAPSATSSTSSPETQTLRAGAPATSTAFGQPQNPNPLVKPLLLTGVVPRCGHGSSQEQRGNLRMAEDVRVLCRERWSAQIPDGKKMIVAQQNTYKIPNTTHRTASSIKSVSLVMWVLQSCRLTALLFLSQDCNRQQLQRPS